MHGTKTRDWLIALAALAVVLALSWLVVTHITNVAADKATDQAVKAVESHEGLPDQDQSPR